MHLAGNGEIFQWSDALIKGKDLTLEIRRQIKAENQSALTDDICVMAYRQELSTGRLQISFRERPTQRFQKIASSERSIAKVDSTRWPTQRTRTPSFVVSRRTTATGKEKT